MSLNEDQSGEKSSDVETIAALKACGTWLLLRFAGVSANGPALGIAMAWIVEDVVMETVWLVQVILEARFA